MNFQINFVHLKTTGLMSKLKEYKAVMIEPRSAEKEIFDDIMKQFYQVIQETSAKGEAQMQQFEFFVIYLVSLIFQIWNTG